MIRNLVHSKSGIFAFVLICFVAGIGLASFVPVIPLSISTIFVAVTTVPLFFYWKKPLPRLIFLLSVSLSLGFLRISAADFLFQKDAMIFINEKQLVLHGVVVALPVINESKATYLVKVDEFLKQTQWQPASGQVILQTDRYPEFQYGDRLSFSCRPKFSDYNRKRQLISQAVVSCESFSEIEKISSRNADPFSQLIFDFRSGFLMHLRANVPEPQAGLLAGLLVGERSISKELQVAFQRTGTTHMIAVSGWNVSLITIALFEILVATFFNRKRAFWLTILLLVGFVGVVGAGASVVRAAIMGGLVLLGNYSGRRGDSFRLLIFAAALMLVINPWLLRYDMGFDLSFAATLGLMVFVTPLEHHLRFVPESFGLRSILSETLAAILATMPLLLVVFHTFSLVAPLANVLVLSIVPIATFIGALGLLCVSLPVIGPFLLMLAWILSSAIIGFVEYLGQWPLASASVFGFDWFLILLSLVAVGLIALLLRTNHELKPTELYDLT